jgi:HAE1 family hydrophobic/amphiphilic exporter-1
MAPDRARGVFVASLPLRLIAALVYVAILALMIAVAATMRLVTRLAFTTSRLLRGEETGFTLAYARNTLDSAVRMLRWPLAGADNPSTRRLAFFASFPVKIALFALCLVWAVLAAVLPSVVYALGWLLRKMLAALGWLVVGSYDRAAHAYHRFLPSALAHPWRVLGTAAVAFAITLALVPTLGLDLIPQLAQGRFDMTVTLPPGTPLAETDQLVDKVATQHAKDPASPRSTASPAPARDSTRIRPSRARTSRACRSRSRTAAARPSKPPRSNACAAACRARTRA